MCYRTVVGRITSGSGDVPTKKLAAEMEILQVANEIGGRPPSVHGLKRWSKKGKTEREESSRRCCLSEMAALPVCLFEGQNRQEQSCASESKGVAPGPRLVENDALSQPTKMLVVAEAVGLRDGVSGTESVGCLESVCWVRCQVPVLLVFSVSLLRRTRLARD